jgi:hypothetical protein
LALRTAGDTQRARPREILPAAQSRSRRGGGGRGSDASRAAGDETILTAEEEQAVRDDTSEIRANWAIACWGARRRRRNDSIDLMLTDVAMRGSLDGR